VLEITGKGSGEGVLRRLVPQWFSTPPFSGIVGGYEEAARHHGGGGALYVRLRRKEKAG
jgi:DNA-nicking Smr family endonuclease